jgi:hypothetical protein
MSADVRCLMAASPCCRVCGAGRFWERDMRPGFAEERSGLVFLGEEHESCTFPDRPRTAGRSGSRPRLVRPTSWAASRAEPTGRTTRDSGTHIGTLCASSSQLSQLHDCLVRPVMDGCHLIARPSLAGATRTFFESPRPPIEALRVVRSWRHPSPLVPHTIRSGPPWLGRRLRHAHRACTDGAGNRNPHLGSCAHRMHHGTIVSL